MSRFTFKKSERLSSLKAIDHLFRNGVSFHAGGLKFIFVLHDQAQAFPCQVVFSVPKKSFKRAVDRNLLKRRMREAYRHQKEELYKHLAAEQKNMHLLIIYTSREIFDHTAVQNAMLKGFNALVQRTKS